MSRFMLVLVVLLACCNSPTKPTEVIETETDYQLAQVPPYFEGFYVRGPDAFEPPGNLHILLLSWGDDIEQIGMSLKARGAVAFVSTHCCLWSNDKHFSPYNWKRIEDEWLTPLRKFGVLAGIYLVDEPGGNGISDLEVLKGSNFVADKGYPTMSVRHWGANRNERLPVDYYGVVAYSGTTKKEWVRDFNRNAPTDFIVGQAFIATTGYEGHNMPDQTYWRETARQLGKPIISWVWRWPGQTGCADVPECVEAWQ